MNFPVELLEIIFSFLDFESLKIVRSISTYWKDVAERNFWKRARLIVKGENCWECSKKLKNASAIDITMSKNYNEKDFIDLFHEICSSSSLTNMRIYERYFTSNIPAEIFSSAIISMKEVTLSDVFLTSQQTEQMFNVIIKKPHKLKYLELNIWTKFQSVNPENISPRILMTAFKSVEFIKIMLSCISTDQMNVILDLQSKWLERWMNAQYEKIPFNEEKKVDIIFDKNWWVVGGAPGWKSKYQC